MEINETKTRPFVRTVLGDINPSSLGFCQCHEHIMLAKGESERVNIALCIDDEDLSRKEVETYRDAGGKTIVDAQPVGCGRMPLALRRISAGTDVNIVASTGFHKLIFYAKDHFVRTADRSFMRDLFIREITEGMYADCDNAFGGLCCEGTRAGMIKTAIDKEGLTPRYRELFTAAAEASNATGAPVMIHIEQNTDPLPVLWLMLENGVAAEKLIFCHLDRAAPRLEIHERICREGSFLEYDTIGREKYHDDTREMEIFSHMLVRGYEDSLLFSLDTTRARLSSYGGVPGLCHILGSFAPSMVKLGFASERQLEKISRINCQRALCVTAAK